MKYKKYQKLKIKGQESKLNKLHYGSFGLKTLEGGEMTSAQFEAIKKLFAFVLKKKVKFWSNCHLIWPKTYKSLGARMGSGKPAVQYYVAKFKKGSIVLEWTGVFSDKSLEFFLKLVSKIGFSCLILYRGL